MSKPGAWEHFRGICLLNVMPMLYMAGVVYLTRRWAEQHLGSSWTASLLFGSEAYCRCEDLLMCLQALLPSGSEWPSQRPVAIASTDIRQAFDYVSPRIVAECLRVWGLPATLVRGGPRKSWSVCGGSVSGHPGHFHHQDGASIRQGGIESPW